MTVAVREETAGDALADVTFGTLATIFCEGDPGDRMFVIHSGHVRLSRRGYDDRELLLAVLGPGDVLGELAVFDPGPRTSTATALTPVTATEVTRSALRALIAARPALGWHLLQRLARRVDTVEEQLVDFVSTDVAGRIARQLVSLASRFDAGDDGTVHLGYSLLPEDLTQLAGAGHTSGRDALGEFVARGWIAVYDNEVVIRDLAALRRCSEREDRELPGGEEHDEREAADVA
ncbi:cAMP-binding protein [Mycolicibacterium chubuense NBB4]|uniref:cAMP-binding protein n=1 Tax=Mycolicibacterium chubuense (strain NBB4) TaxID=710421 RepID=I4BFJ9_MYCCN|nr:Crp/Fnr family transcriptional regulator [Mycolicibacterium chubuense]AFM16056.1 cAMP-binding protein [Mycolicibacterium chubuense NBB4]